VSIAAEGHRRIVTIFRLYTTSPAAWPLAQAH
jgi:hypothetical protein